ncbi:MAG TPA: hypothetical protein RMH99_06460 [Sandaracinaceae bacterium LLY-WYZ-13_1]|nr:hypothetical protein [Sandaracinaceae bacterium LLY-WYZ-13_1]
MGTDPSRLVDAILGGSFLVVGLSLLFVSLSVVGLAFWLAPRMRPTGVASTIGRAVLGAVGAAILTLGVWMASMGVEATSGFSLGPSSGGSAWVAWYLGSKVLAWDAALTMGLLQQLQHRSEDGVHGALSMIGAAWAFGTWAFAKLCAFLLFVVVLGLLLNAAGFGP